MVEGTSLVMEVDARAKVSVILEYTHQSLFPKLPPNKTSVMLKTYASEPMPVVGELHVQVCYGMHTAIGPCRW